MDKMRLIPYGTEGKELEPELLLDVEEIKLYHALKDAAAKPPRNKDDQEAQMAVRAISATIAWLTVSRHSQTFSSRLSGKA